VLGEWREEKAPPVHDGRKAGKRSGGEEKGKKHFPEEGGKKIT